MPAGRRWQGHRLGSFLFLVLPVRRLCHRDRTGRCSQDPGAVDAVIGSIRNFRTVPLMAYLHRCWLAGITGCGRPGRRMEPDVTSDSPSFAARKCPCLAAYFRWSNFRHTILFMVTEEQIHDWADEAEAGYDVEEMQRRGRGRPGRGAEPMQVVAVRLTAEELAAVDAIADREKISRSEAIRRALAGFAA